MTSIGELNREFKNLLIDFSKKDLNDYNPYSNDGLNLTQIAEEFLDKYKKGLSDFSWVSALNCNNKIRNVKTEKKNKFINSANVNYGLPTHYRGDIENGYLYLCLFNPGSNGINDEYKKDVSIKEYYSNFKDDDDDKILIAEDSPEKIESYINGCESILTKELKKFLQDFNKDQNKSEIKDDLGYYTYAYFLDIAKQAGYIKKDGKKYIPLFHCQKNKLTDRAGNSIEEITNKIVNIDLFPFRSKSANTIVLDYDNKFSLFSAYIILHRIGKNIESDNDKKLAFCFRSYDTWRNVLIIALKKIIKDQKKKITNEDIDENLDKLYFEYFYQFPGQAARISPNNLMRKIGKYKFDSIINLVEKNN
ncbi:hypothetical protein [Anaerococcus degeneri]|uniref:Uncharacterized protein n=1 Tax=Anaerococcus degeneri TaxID=361500 RepID=A0ABS7YZQ4_9FIRM|nr:hypothetical protein [Anaerococcus degeneri]MBP2014724.1 hypothetical protein [Anaerococcus degeneri]MCA2096935.1 hypothetical protein [Anaerococcus degeneri]